MPTGYVVPVNKRQQKTLRDAGIRASLLTVDDVEGIAVPEDDFVRVLDLLDCTVASKKASEQYQGVVVVVLKKRDPEAKSVEVICDDWDGKTKSRFMAIAQEALGALLFQRGFRQLTIDVPHKTIRKPINDGGFYIHIWSSPEGAATMVPPGKLLGTKVSCRDEAFGPSGQGFSFIDPESDWTIAELVGDCNLYIHHDIVHHGSSSEHILFQHLLEEVRHYLELDEKGRLQLQEDVKRRRIEASANEYIRFCSKRIEGEVSRLQEEADSGRKRLGELQQKLTETMAMVRDAEELLITLSERQRNQDEHLRREFELLLNAPEIIDIRVQPDKVIVYTDVIYCVDPRNNQEHEIGKFRIELFFNTTDCVRWYNMTRLVKTKHGKFNAPHVNEKGAGCLGNMGDKDRPERGVYPTLLRELKLHQAILMAIKFLQSVNVNDNWGSCIDKWPARSTET